MAQYSVDLSINTKGYTDGIEEAKQSNAQFDSSVVKTDRSLASLKKEVGQARRAVENLAFAYAKMSKAEQQSGTGKALKRQLDEAKKYAADLKDLAQDVNQEISNMASDTAGWDAMKQGIGVARDGLTALATVVADVTGDEDAFKDVLVQVARIQSIANAAVSIGNALQKQSAIMIGIRKVQEAALAKAINAEAAATGKATIAQRVFNAVAKANPYVLLLTGLLAVGGAIATFIALTSKGTDATAKLNKEFHAASLQGQKDAQDDVVKLEVLYKKTQDVNISIAARKKAVKELQDQYPAYFSNMSTEQIMLGQASEKYQQLKEDIIAVAMAKAYEQKISEKAKENVDLQDQLETQRKITEERKKQAAADMNGGAGFVPGMTSMGTGAQELGAQASIQASIDKEKELQGQIDENTAAMGKYYDAINKSTDAQQRLNQNTKNNKGGGSNNNYAKDSITALEHQLSDLQKKRKDGLLPELNTEQYLNKIKDLQDQINQKKIELGIELPPDELRQVQQEIDTLKANQLRPELRLDAKQYQEELQRLTDKKERIEVEIGYKVEPKVDTSDADKVKQIMEDIYAPKEMNLDFSALKERLPEELGEQVQATVDRYKEVEEARKRLTEIMNDEGSSDAAIAAAEEGLERLDEEWKQLIEDVNTYNAANKEIVTANKNMKALSASVQQVGTAVQAAGQLFTALGEASEDNSGKVMGIVAQAIATVALSFAQALTSCKTWVDWLAFGITGLATMVTMIAQINSVTGGYAEGGIIPGSSYSGDLLTANVNSGEMILNKRQQKNLFDAIDNNKLDGGNQTSNVAITSTRIKGSDIVLSIKNQGKLDHKKYLND